MEYIDELAEDAEESPETIESFYEELSYLTEHPINLNLATAEQLKRIPFLSDIQILNLLDYPKKQGSFASIYELKNVRFMDMETIELILPFVYVGAVDKERPFTGRNMLQYGKNELMARYDQCLQEKSGYADYPDSILQQYPNRKYVGEPFYTSIRYAYGFENRLQAGFVGEKDAGEAFRNSRHKGYDYYSAHVFLKDVGKIRSLAVGDYKISFGQGLVVSNDFTPSRSSILSQVERRNNGFRRHYSTNETDFFRGVASTATFGKMDVSAFYSNRKVDAIADDETISSFKTDGLHRTSGDWDKRHTARIESFGGNVRYIGPRLLLGVTAMTTSFDGRSVEPELAPYNRFYFRGKRNTNIGADYAWRHRSFIFFGETAFSQNGAAATLNALQWSVSSGLKALILYRSYDRKYQSFYGRAFSQGSTVQNEEGVYVCLQWAPIARWQFAGYADFFRYPWIKYGIDAPSSGKEYMLQADFTGVKNTVFSLRYRLRQREKNNTEEKEVRVIPVDQHRLRLQINHKPSEYLTFRTTLEGNAYDENVSSISRGWVIAQSTGWKNTHSSIQGDFYAAYFHTDDYDSRVYANEKNMLYNFSFPSFYGKGARLSTIWRYHFTKDLYVSVKAGWTHYFNRDTIGTGAEAIDGRDKIDLYTQLRWKF
jgi:hypothetical protein